MSEIQAMEFHLVDDDVEIKVEYETHGDLDLNHDPDPHSDWKLNPNVECRVTLHRLPSKIIKQEYEGIPNSSSPEYINYSLTILKNIKEESDKAERHSDPLGDSELEGKWKHRPKTKNFKNKTKIITDEARYKCEVCEKIFRCSYELRRHKFCHQIGNKLHKCETCGKCFATRSQVKRHMVCHVDTKSFECDLCGKGFASKMYLNTHKASHTGVKRFRQCNVCEKKFARLHTLKKHIEYFHTADNNKPYKCGVCEKCFSTKNFLKSHGIFHTRAKEYKCETCGKVYTTQEYLTKHMFIHTGLSPHKCKVCGKTFIGPSELKRHFLCSHTEDKNFKCDTCGKCFRMNGYLKNHAKTHAVKKQWKCDICDKCFNLSNYLQKHRLTHTTEKKD